jgi:aminotransferase
MHSFVLQSIVLAVRCQAIYDGFSIRETNVTTTDSLHLSAAAPRTVQSEIRAMTVACDDMGGINLAQGVCDTDPPAIVLEGAQRAIRDGFNIYTRADGIPRLRRAIANQLARTHGIEVDPDREILITSGATGAFQSAMEAILNPGDEVLLFEPFYGYHANMLRARQVVPVPVAMTADADTRWNIDLDAVRAALTPKTRAMVVNTPSNPAGKVFTREELEGLAAIAEERELFIFTDEIYEHFIYGSARHISPASLPGVRGRTILMSGFSKTFSVTGWRIGYLVADARWLPSITYFQDMTYVCAPAPLQQGVADGVEQLPPSFYTALATEHLAKRTMLVNALRDAGLTPHIPDGAYYVLASTGMLQGRNAAEKSRDLLARTGVASVAGSAFFRPGSTAGEELLRFCYAKRDSELLEACARLRTLAAGA